MEDNNYTVMELFQELKKDESWEKDEKLREEIANMLYMDILRL